MPQSPFDPGFDDLPETLPVFPLAGVLLLPGGRLPLNIFEPRYLAMVDYALGAGRMIGMVQPRQTAAANDERLSAAPRLYATGCAGRIVEFSETPDGRYLITLQGVCRYRAESEIEPLNGFRRVKADWGVFRRDMETGTCIDLDRGRLKTLIRQYFTAQGMECDWEAFDGAPDNRLMTCLSMICPFTAEEKQALLEAACCQTRAGLFMALLEMAVRGEDSCACH